MATPNWSEITTTTLYHRSKALADNVIESNALLTKLNQRGNVKPFSGGVSIVEELSFAENSTYTRYSGYDPLNISPSEVLSAAEYAIKMAAVAVTMSGLEELQNSGPEKMIDLLEARIDNAMSTMRNNISADLYSAGTADGGKQIGGLQALVSDTGLGTVGGIVSDTWSFWQNKIYDFSAEPGAPTASATTIQAAMNTLYTRLALGNDNPDLIVADNVFWTYYLSSLQTNQRFTNEKMAAAGFDNLRFMQADVVLDGGLGGSAPASHMYFLNTRYLKLRPHRDRNFAPINPDRYATNQDAFVRLMGWAGNLTTNNRRRQGVIVL